MDKVSWTKITSTHRKKCEKILKISKEIRYAGVFNEYGHTIAGKIRPGIKPIFSPNEVREEFFNVALSMRAREKSSKLLGDLEYILINHKKINILLFHKDAITYYITIGLKIKSTPLFINKIKKIIT
jgi:hypothetical protein